MPKKKDASPPPPKDQILPNQGGPVRNPNRNDVLCGRGGRINAHPGNVQFREIVDQLKHTYLSKQTKKLEKAHIAARVVTQIRGMDPPGRFLKEDPKTGLWMDIGDAKARKKAGQALREDGPDIRHELEEMEPTDGGDYEAQQQQQQQQQQQVKIKKEDIEDAKLPAANGRAPATIALRTSPIVTPSKSSDVISAPATTTSAGPPSPFQPPPARSISAPTSAAAGAGAGYYHQSPSQSAVKHPHPYRGQPGQPFIGSGRGMNRSASSGGSGRYYSPSHSLTQTMQNPPSPPQQAPPPPPPPQSQLASPSQQLQPRPYHQPQSTVPPTISQRPPSPTPAVSTYQQQPSQAYYPHHSAAAAAAGYHHSPYHPHFLPHPHAGPRHSYQAANPQNIQQAPHLHGQPAPSQQAPPKFPPESIASKGSKTSSPQRPVTATTSPNSKDSGNAMNISTSSSSSKFKNVAFDRQFTPLERGSSSDASSRTLSTVSTISVDTELLVRGSSSGSGPPPPITREGISGSGAGSQRHLWQQQEAAHDNKQPFEVPTPPPISEDGVYPRVDRAPGGAGPNQIQQPQPQHPLRHAYTTINPYLDHVNRMASDKGSSGRSPSMLSDMSLSFQFSSSLGLTRSASLPGLRTSELTWGEDDALLLPRDEDDEDEDVHNILKNADNKQPSWVSSSFSMRYSNRENIPGPGKPGRVNAAAAPGSGSGSSGEVGSRSSSSGAKKPAAINTNSTSPAGNEINSSSSGKTSSAFSFSQTRHSSKSSESTLSFGGPPVSGGHPRQTSGGSGARQSARVMIHGSSNASFTGMSFTSINSSTSSWLAPYKGMESVASDINPWNDESRSVMSDISTDLLALDLAENPPAVPPRPNS